MASYLYLFIYPYLLTAQIFNYEIYVTLKYIKLTFKKENHRQY